MRTNRPTLRFVALLLLTALALVATVGLAIGETESSEARLSYQCSKGEDADESENTRPNVIRDDRRFAITVSHGDGDPSYEAGDRVNESVTIKTNRLVGNPQHVTIVWHEPSGATDVDYGDNPPTSVIGGAATWENVPVAPDGSVQGPTVSYTAGLPIGSAGGTGTDSSTLDVSWQGLGDQSMHTAVSSAYRVGFAETDSLNPKTAARPAAPAPSDEQEREVWMFQRWVGLASVGITEENWGDWQAGWGDDVHFFGFCYPLAETYTDTVPVPVVFNGEHDPALMLVTYLPDLTEIAREELELAPDYATLLRNTQDEQGHWVALKLPEDANLAPPPGVELPGGDWELFLSVALDLGGAPGEMDDETMYFYVGLDGEGHPDPQGGAGIKDGLYQGHGVTILGPWPVRLREWYIKDPAADPPVVLAGLNNGDAEPGQRVTATHKVVNMVEGPLDVSLSACAESGAQVSMYVANAQGPTLPLTPITNPLPVEGSTTGYVALAADMPYINGGVETWRLTASVPSSERVAEIVDLIWVGDWVAPPEGAPTPVPKRVLLPIVMR